MIFDEDSIFSASCWRFAVGFQNGLFGAECVRRAAQEGLCTLDEESNTTSNTVTQSAGPTDTIREPAAPTMSTETARRRAVEPTAEALLASDTSITLSSGLSTSDASSISEL